MITPHLIDDRSVVALVEPIDEALASITDRLVKDHHRLYLVGGVVRDILLNEPSHDIDLTTDARPPAIKSAVGPDATALWTQGEKFGTVGARIGTYAVEITTHRAESYDPQSRKPTVSFGDSLLDDLSRRDFTINSIAIGLPLSADDTGRSSVELLDPFGGRADLDDRVLRTPLSADISFIDDPLRMLRAARFIARFGLRPADDLEGAAIAHAHRLAIVSVERISVEVERLLALPDPRPGLDFLDRTTVLTHSLTAVAVYDPAATARAIDLASVPGSAAVRRAGLFWPLGPDGADRELDRLRYPTADRRATVNLLAAAGAPEGLHHPTDREVRMAVDRVGFDHLSDLRALIERAELHAFTSALDRLAAEEDLSDLDSPLSGQQIITVAHLTPGPKIGEAQRHLRNLRLSNGPMTSEQAVEALNRWLKGVG